MNFFKKLFGKSEKPKSNTATSGHTNTKEEEIKRMLKQMNISDKTPEMFHDELITSLMRYKNDPLDEPAIKITDQNGKVLPPHIAFGELYQQWNEIQSPWDRRSLLFGHWDDSFLDDLEKWQILDRFVRDRYAPKALQYSQTYITDEDLKNPKIVVALSKMHRSLDDKTSALKLAKSAYELAPNNDGTKAEYATVLHLMQDHADQELSHKLMSELVKDRITASEEENISLLNFFSFSPNYIDSSIFTMMYLTMGKGDIPTWEHFANEYYHCPFFRYEHSVFLSQNGEAMRAMAKMNSLANEFPWHKDAVNSSIDTIHQMRRQTNNPNAMEEQMRQMLKHQENWKN